MDSGVADDVEVEVTARQRWTSWIVWAAAVAAAVALVTVSVQRFGTSHGDHSPYSASAVQAHVTLSEVGAGHAQAAVNRLAGKGRLSVAVPEAAPAAKLVVGQLTFRTPRDAPATGQYALFVLDSRGHPVRGMWGVGPAGANVAQGWHGSYDKVAKKYSWLRGLASVVTDGGRAVSDPGMAVSFSPRTPAPITFVAEPDPAAAGEVTVALVFISASERVYWAAKLN